MEVILNDWYVILALIGVLGMCAIVVVDFTRKPQEEQLDKVREWLLWAVTEAERKLGSGTGQLKLRSVYDLFVQRFPAMVSMISFEMFSEMVDDALIEMRYLLANNKKVQAIVQGGEHNANCD